MTKKLRIQLVALLSIFVYIVFSQFFIKAWVSTDFSVYSQADFCMTKKMDTYESKWSCRSMHNIADTFAVQDLLGTEPFFLNILLPWNAWYKIIDHIATYTFFLPNAPPWAALAEYAFLKNYIWVSLSLL